MRGFTGIDARKKTGYQRKDGRTNQQTDRQTKGQRHPLIISGFCVDFQISQLPLKLLLFLLQSGDHQGFLAFKGRLEMCVMREIPVELLTVSSICTESNLMLTIKSSMDVHRLTIFKIAH